MCAYDAIHHICIFYLHLLQFHHFIPQSSETNLNAAQFSATGLIDGSCCYCYCFIYFVESIARLRMHSSLIRLKLQMNNGVQQGQSTTHSLNASKSSFFACARLLPEQLNTNAADRPGPESHSTQQCERSILCSKRLFVIYTWEHNGA